MEKLDSPSINEKYEKFINHEVFSTEALREGVAQEEKVKERLNVAIGIFSSNG